MDVAKLSGNITKFNKLNQLSKSIDLEIHRNPEIMPIFAKAFINNNHEIESKSLDSKNNLNEIQTFNSPAEENNKNIEAIKEDELNNFFKNTIMNQNKPLEKVNMLFSMAQGKSADHFISSKSYTEVNHKAHSTYNAHQAFTLGLVDIFDVAAFQKSENYRAPAKKIINLNPIKIPEKKKKVNEKKLKRKTGLSTLAIIREESKIANSKKLKNASKHATIKKQSSMSIPALHKFSLKTNI